MKIVRDKSSPGFPRRRFLETVSALGAASFLGLAGTAAAEPPPETKRIRLAADEGICLAPQFLSAELLRLEGFTEVEYIRTNYEEYASSGFVIAAGKTDITQDAAISFATLIDAGQPVVVLSGIHIGCWELFGGPAFGRSAISRASASSSLQPVLKNTY